MENLSDYSSYVMAAYTIAALVITGFALIVLIKYWRLKKLRNEK